MSSPYASLISTLPRSDGTVATTKVRSGSKKKSKSSRPSRFFQRRSHSHASYKAAGGYVSDSTSGGSSCASTHATQDDSIASFAATISVRRVQDGPPPLASGRSLRRICVRPNCNCGAAHPHRDNHSNCERSIGPIDVDSVGPVDVDTLCAEEEQANSENHYSALSTVYSEDFAADDCTIKTPVQLAMEVDDFARELESGRPIRTNGSKDAADNVAAKLSATTIISENQLEGPVDVDDFIPPDCYGATDTSFVIDESEICRGLAGYVEGFEPKIVTKLSWNEHVQDEINKNMSFPSHHRSSSAATGSPSTARGKNHQLQASAVEV